MLAKEIKVHSSSFSGIKLTENSILGLNNGVTVKLEKGKIPESLNRVFNVGGEIPAFVKWILLEESKNLYILKDCTVKSLYPILLCTY